MVKILCIISLNPHYDIIIPTLQMCKVRLRVTGGIQETELGQVSTVCFPLASPLCLPVFLFLCLIIPLQQAFLVGSDSGQFRAHGGGNETRPRMSHLAAKELEAGEGPLEHGKCPAENHWAICFSSTQAHQGAGQGPVALSPFHLQAWGLGSSPWRLGSSW